MANNIPPRAKAVQIVRTSLSEHFAYVPYEVAEGVVKALEQDQPFHFLEIDDKGWWLEHSFACRLDQTIGTCEWNRFAAECDPYEIPPGKYKIVVGDDFDVTLEAVDEQ